MSERSPFEEEWFEVAGYRVAADRYYDPESHLWVAPGGSGPARCGFDPLGSETCGDIVAVSFEPIGTRVRRGEAFGSMEAAKFVGPLLSPISGTVVEHNREVVARPSLLGDAPLESWLAAIEPSSLEEDLARLLHGREAVAAWFEAEVLRFRRRGMLAE